MGWHLFHFDTGVAADLIKMKLLVITLVVCVANLANCGSLGSARKLATDMDNLVNSSKNQNTAQNAANAVAPAKIAANAVKNAATTSATTKAAPVTKAPAPVAPSTTAVPPAPVPPPKPVATAAPVARLVPVESASPSAAAPSGRGSKSLAYAEAIATITSDDAYNVPDENTPDTKSANSEGDSEILRYEAEVRVDGFRYSYETSNGISAESNGETKNVNGTDVIVMKGFYEYTDKEGNLVHVDYTADEEGYHPESDVLPTAPPVPPAIAEAIKYILNLNEAKEDSAAQ